MHSIYSQKRGPKAPQGKVITREDIEKLGLSADLLKGKECLQFFFHFITSVSLAGGHPT